MRRILKLIAIGIAVCLSANFASAEKVKVGELYYNYNTATKTASVAADESYKSMESVEIPGSVSIGGVDYTVTELETSSFLYCYSLKSVKIGEGVKTIGKWSFYNDNSLTSITLPESLTTIVSSAFSGCSALTGLKLPDNVTSIQDYAFAYCTSLTELALPAKMKKLDLYAFNGCTSLAELSLPEGLEEIGACAFYNSAIKSVTIPSTMTAIGTQAFSNCKSLTSVKLPSALTSIGEMAFNECSALADITLPESLTSIGTAAFNNCAALTSLTLPSRLGSLGASAFYGTGLTEVTIPASLTEISPSCFYMCRQLTKINLHDGITSIGKMAFQYCSKLASIDLPSGLTAIQSGCFSDCTSLTEVSIPAGVTEIQNNAFYCCTRLQQIDISANVKSIGSAWVSGCSALKAINVDAANPYYCSIDGVLFDKSAKTFMAFPGAKGGDYTVPDGVSRIQSYAFFQNRNIVNVIFPESLKSIGVSAFYGCSSIDRVELPQSLDSIGNTCYFFSNAVSELILPNRQTMIGNNAFSTTRITSFIVPEGFTSLGIDETDDKAFSVLGSCGNLTCISLPSTLKIMSPIASGCNNLKGIYCFAVEPPTLKGENVITTESTVYVPKGSAAAYKAAWGALYPSMKFVDALPGGPELTAADGVATLRWEAYEDKDYTATPLYYLLTFTANGEEYEETLDDSDRSFEFVGADYGTGEVKFVYNLRGFTANGEVTLCYKGEFTLDASAALHNVESDHNDTPSYYDLMGRRATKGLLIGRGTKLIVP